jgi:ribosomal protein S18 acetylase RimI-like enzyme
LGYVSELFVDQDQRALGIGSALLAEAERRFREKGILRMVVSVAEHNHGAVRLYERFGFGPYIRVMLKPLA